MALAQARWRPRRGAHFTLAYSETLSRRVPLLYATVILAVVTAAWTFRDVAPASLTLWVPAVMIATMALRASAWLPHHVAHYSLPERERDIAIMSRIGPLLSAALGFWAMALYGYGDEARQSMIHFAVALTGCSCILILSHNPLAALRLGAVLLIPTAAWYLWKGHPNAVGVAALQVGLGGMMAAIVTGHHRDFVRLELSRRKLAAREREAQVLAEANRRHAVLDPLTGLANRRSLLATLERLVAPQRTAPWIALIDLDGFKPINDTYGHRAGDEVLCAVAARIAAHPLGVACGRLGGDEFAIVLPGTFDLAQARASMEDLIAALRQPIRSGEDRLRVSCSIGCYRPMPGESILDTLERADAALYKAKERGGTVEAFSLDDERALDERRAITRIFHSTDLGEQVNLAYQPIVDTETGAIVCFEALARWSPDGRRWLMPGNFVHVAEATGRIAELTEVVMARALTECPAWKHGVRMAINLSARDLLRENAPAWLAGIARKCHTPADHIVLEVTETALLSDYDRARAHVAALREHGFQVALDDFGTGQSSLSHVHRLPLDYIKIDQTFAHELAGDHTARAIVATMAALARQIGLHCAIEGIETEEQRATAAALGLRLMQGYLFGHPESARTALGLLRNAA
ncbi:putative bifunctional diguanylate cyclase/phosphodiesterase [Parablastomonas sp. CN1-191]|uniref:putative bifunctional diguanylate cyclase/phosphodiesterase n=1 Tax=Parablastomonas sp. CN1-191 TaxID=3400908 RepID=UPI003BF8F091